MSDDFEIFVEPEDADAMPFYDTKLVAVAGARGGIGTSLGCASVAMYLATIGRRVLVVDADPHSPSLHAHLGGRFAAHTPTNMNAAGVALESLVFDDASMGEPNKSWATEDAQGPYDYIVVDLGLGISDWALETYLDADVGIFFTAPDPVAMDAMGRFLRRAFDAHLNRLLDEDDEARAALQVTRNRMQEGTAGDAQPFPARLLRRLKAEGSSVSEKVEQALQSFLFLFVVSMVRRREDTELANALRSVMYRRLRIAAEPLAFVDHDDAAVTAMRLGRPMIVESPMSRASKCIERLTRRLVGVVERGLDVRTPRTTPFESHHGVLEVEREASAELVRRASKRLLGVFSEDALWLGGLYTDDELAMLRAQIEEARETLLDKHSRRAYEQSLFDEHGVFEESNQPSTERHSSMPPPPLITPDTSFDGALIRAVRESQGITLRDVSDTTRVPIRYLEAIEEEDFETLPAAVYIRGFVGEFAKCLRLDGAQVSRTYLELFRAFEQAQETP